jgi:hypothetical protein
MASSPTAIVFLGDQPPVPAKQRIGCHQRCDPEEPIAAEFLRLGCKTTSLSVSEAQTPTADLLAKHPVLRLQVLDDVLLTAIHPSGDDQDQELKM